MSRPAAGDAYAPKQFRPHDDGTPIVAIEAGRGETLRRFVGRRGLVIGMESFGASAPYGDLAEHFGFTAKSVAARVKAAV